MAYTITNHCIGCDRCRIQCPTEAISRLNGTYQIDLTRCNNCAGFYGTPQCAAICPTNQGCLPAQTVVDSGAIEYWDYWFNRYNFLLERLRSQKQTQYWNQWFDRYSQAIASLLDNSAYSL